MSSSVLPGSDASRPRSGILTPSSEGSLNHPHGSLSADSEGRKRKRADSLAMDHLLKPSIAVKPHPHSLHVQPRVLQPLMLLPRQHLPLSCIDLGAPSGDLSPSRFFESHVKILDLESRMGSAQSVLIARSDPKGTVYALERQDNGLYVMCKLGSWVQLDVLASKATAVSRERLQPASQEQPQPHPFAGLTTPQTHKEHKRKRSAIEAIQSLVRKRARSQSVSTFDDITKPSTITEVEDDAQLPSPDIGLDQQACTEPKQPSQSVVLAKEAEKIEEPTQTADIIFNNIKTHYFEALYKSMGSLAYFAKGPMSRARSAFRLDLEASLDISDLIDFLKSLVLTTVQIDKKYRDTLPDMISKLKNDVDSSDEGAKRKRRTKRFKLGKDGLYPAEDESIQEWWNAHKPELKHDETSHSMQQIKSHASLLRSRETQLQMILILEILALEPLKTSDEAGEDSLPTLPGAAEAGGQMAPPPSKKRNKHNLPVLVDVHADRLTIWQSTASDEQLLLEDSQVTTQPGQGVQQRSSTEPLKDFCVDVIVPFFSARLPEVCDSINRKLGGPVIVSPPKSRTAKAPSSKKEQRPGAAAKRPVPPNAPRTLQRALSTEQLSRRSVSRGPSNMIALMRSATSTSLPGVKREGSEPAALRPVSKGDLNAMGQRRSSLSRSSSSNNLEDFKANKKAQVEAELKDAISALRKPNRDVVGKALAEAAQQRTVTTQPAKKTKKPARSSLGSAVQVKATPTNNRFKDMMGAKSTEFADVPLPSTEEIIPPSSVGTLVPSTAPRNGHMDVMFGSSSTLDVVGSTPIKASARPNFLRRPLNEEPAMPPSSPLMSRGASGADNSILGCAVTPLKKRAFPASQGLFETPVKRSAPRPVYEDALPVPEQKEVSIYEKLGWDDDLDDL